VIVSAIKVVISILFGVLVFSFIFQNSFGIGDFPPPALFYLLNLLIVLVIFQALVWTIRRIFNVPNHRTPMTINDSSTTVTTTITTGDNSPVEVNIDTSKTQINTEKVNSLCDELVREVFKLNEKIDDVNFGLLNFQAKLLKSEASKKNPSASLFIVTAKGLKEAAEALGEIAIPLVKIVTAIIALV
jgi:hypothetical protein